MLSSRRANSSDQDHSSGRENPNAADLSNVDFDEKSENDESEEPVVKVVLTTKAEISPHQPDETTEEESAAIKAAAASMPRPTSQRRRGKLTRTSRVSDETPAAASAPEEISKVESLDLDFEATTTTTSTATANHCQNSQTDAALTPSR